MIFNKENRIKYLGFDDVRFSIIGILILSIVTSYMFNDSFGKEPLLYMLIGWSISLGFTICNWISMRWMLIFLRKKYPAFEDNVKRILILIGIVITTVFSINWAGEVLLKAIFGESVNVGYKTVVPVIIISIMVQALYEAAYYYIRLKRSIREEEQAKQVIVQAQLDALRNQAQPHFFFNSMNTLRDIIDQNSKEEAKEFVNKLSDLYRYILETRESDMVTVTEELAFAKAYIHIQQERFADNLVVNWISDETSHDQLIAPMSVQLLLENAIKHNVVSVKSPLKIDVVVHKNKLTVRNRIHLKSSVILSTKMGLENISKRYQLITGQNIDVINDGVTFSVQLPLISKTKNRA